MLRFFSLLLSLATCVATADMLTSRASLASGGVEVFGGSSDAAMDHSGTAVVFLSLSTTLVPGDTNGRMDVFVHDRFWGATTRVSVSSTGEQANNISQSPTISPDGRYVAFVSFATNLVPNDTNNQADVFVHDRVTRETRRISVGSIGEQANQESRNPSFGGNLVCFDSFASNLVPNDTNQMPDVFTHNLLTGETQRVSLAWNGAQGNFMSDQSQISADGRIVAFRANATNLVENDNNQADDVFVRLLETNETMMVSVAPNLGPSNGNSGAPTISETGRFIAFESTATNLVGDDTNGERDVFVRDMLCLFTLRASISTSGEQANSMSTHPTISADGRYVSFFTFATNLVPEPLGFNENVVMRDTGTWTTSLISRNTPGSSANFISRGPGMSGNGRFVAYEAFATNLVPLDANNSLDIFVADTMATGLGPFHMDLTRGTIRSGDLSSVQTSNDVRLELRPGVTLISNQAAIEIHFAGQVGENVADLEMFIESSASTANISQRIEFFNYETCLFDDLGSKTLTLIDGTHGAQPNGEMRPYINGGQVWARVQYRAVGPVLIYPYTVRIDQVRFVASQ
jgi:Tol biopolymer transport system component